MHLCMKRSSPHASMPVSFSFPFQFKALVQSSKIAKEPEVHILAILQVNTTRSDLLAGQFRSQTHGKEDRICVDLHCPIMIGPETLGADCLPNLKKNGAVDPGAGQL